MFPGALLALAAQGAQAQRETQTDLRGWPAITPEMLTAAAAIAAIKLTPEQVRWLEQG